MILPSDGVSQAAQPRGSLQRAGCREYAWNLARSIVGTREVLTPNMALELGNCLVGYVELHITNTGVWIFCNPQSSILNDQSSIQSHRPEGQIGDWSLM